MSKERISIEIESHGEYDEKKEFNFQLMLDGKQFLDLVGNILAYIETNKIEEYRKPDAPKA